MYKNAFKGSYHNTDRTSDKSYILQLFFMLHYFNISFYLIFIPWLCSSCWGFSLSLIPRINQITVNLRTKKKKKRMKITINSYKLFLFILLGEYGNIRLRLPPSNEMIRINYKRMKQICEMLFDFKYCHMTWGFCIFLLYKISIDDRGCPPYKSNSQSCNWGSSLVITFGRQTTDKWICGRLEKFSMI